MIGVNGNFFLINASYSKTAQLKPVLGEFRSKFSMESEMQLYTGCSIENNEVDIDFRYNRK